MSGKHINLCSLLNRFLGGLAGGFDYGGGLLRGLRHFGLIVGFGLRELRLHVLGKLQAFRDFGLTFGDGLHQRTETEIPHDEREHGEADDLDDERSGFDAELGRYLRKFVSAFDGGSGTGQNLSKHFLT